MADNGDVHEASGRCEGCGARYEPGEVACSMCGRAIGAAAEKAATPGAGAAPAIHREHARDPAAAALERAHASGRLPALMRTEPSRETAIKRQWGVLVTGAVVLLMGIGLLSITSSEDGLIKRRRRMFQRYDDHTLSLRGLGWVAAIGGVGMAVLAFGRVTRIKTMPAAKPRLAWLEQSRRIGKGPTARYEAELRWEDGTRSTLKATTDAWQVMTSDDVGIAWIANDRVLHWVRVRL